MYQQGGRWEPQLNIGLFAAPQWGRDCLAAGIGFELAERRFDDKADAGRERLFAYFEVFQRLVAASWRVHLEDWLRTSGGFIQLGDEPPATDLLPGDAVASLIAMPTPAGHWLGLLRPVALCRLRRRHRDPQRRAPAPALDGGHVHRFAAPLGERHPRRLPELTPLLTMLFTPLQLRGVTLRNRIVVSPMCQYSSRERYADGLAPRAPRQPRGRWGRAGDDRGDGRRRPRGASAGRTSASGRTTHVETLARDRVHRRARARSPGSSSRTPAARRSAVAPWKGGGRAAGRRRLGAGLGRARCRSPRATAAAGADARTSARIVASVRRGRTARARRRLRGSSRSTPRTATCCTSSCRRSQQRTDEYGGRFDNRTRLGLRGRDAVRGRSGRRICRSSCGSPHRLGRRRLGRRANRWSCVAAEALGVDLIDVSGGTVAGAEFPSGRATRCRSRNASAARPTSTGAVGLITEPAQADRDRRATARPISSFSPASYCAIPTGRCTRRGSSVRLPLCPCRMRAPINSASSRRPRTGPRA